MEFLDLSLSSPEANLACDEALLNHSEATPGREVLRVWESDRYFLVLGYANRVAEETFPECCQAEGVPILRRCSGGGSVLQGPGCLNYTLALQWAQRPELQSILSTNQFIMETHRRILAQLLNQPVQIQGSTDLTLHNLKFSGNAQRRKRKALLFHGTFLLGMNLALIGRYLQMPKRQPQYRSQREHEGFLTCLPLPAEKLKQALQAAWNARQPAADWPEAETSRLVCEKYSTNTWNRRR